MIRKNITMVHAAKIASWGYPGCKTVQGVANFCKKNKNFVNCVWWKPTYNQKVLLVDPQSFRQTWKKINTEPTFKQGQKPKYGSRTTSRPRGWKQTKSRTWRRKTVRRRTY